MKIKNLTSDYINLMLGDKIITIKPNNFILKVPEKIIRVGEVNGIPIIEKTVDLDNFTFGELSKLKNIINENDIIIVSPIIAKLCNKLKDDNILLYEEINKIYIIGDTVKDENGNIVGINSLSKIHNI